MEIKMTVKKTRLIIIILSCLLAAAVSALAVLLIIRFNAGVVTTEVVVKDNYIRESSASSGRLAPANAGSIQTLADVVQKSSTDSTTIELHRNNPEESVPFNVSNMFPGDVNTKIFRVKVSYKNSVTVHYNAAVRKGYEKLAEVLKCKITLNGGGTPLYDGLMKDMPGSVDYKLPESSGSTEAELVYEISGYLETSVGNDYQEKDLIADFKWWVADDEHKHLDTPKTGDTARIILWVSVAAAAVVLLAVLLPVWFKKRRQEMKR